MDINEDLPVDGAEDVKGGVTAPEELNDLNDTRRGATAGAAKAAKKTLKNSGQMDNVPDPQPH